MPTQATIKKIGINPFAIASSKGYRKGTAKYNEVVHAITHDALGRKKIGIHKKRKSNHGK